MHHGQDHHVKIHQLLLRLQGLAAFTAFGYFLFSAGRKFGTLREVCSAYESFGLGKFFYSLGTCQDAPKPIATVCFQMLLFVCMICHDWPEQKECSAILGSVLK